MWLFCKVAKDAFGAQSYCDQDRMLRRARNGWKKEKGGREGAVQLISCPWLANNDLSGEWSMIL
jgi:hypothetical protein